MKMKKWLALGLAIAMTFSATACQSPNSPGNQAAVLAETHGALSEKIKSAVKTQPNMVELANTLTEGLSSANEADADSAVLLYVRYADSMSSHLASTLIYKSVDFSEKFNAVYNQEFNSNWDEQKIEKISDPEVKAVFEDLNKSLFKIDSYGEYFGPIVNYQKVSELPGISKDLRTYYQTVASLYSLSRLANQIQGLDYAVAAQYAATLEDIYNNAKDITLKEESESMIRFALNLYYTGTEGSSPFDFEKNTLKQGFVDATKEVVKKYPNYQIGKLGKTFLDLSDQNGGKLTTDYADVVINYKKFGFDSPYEITSKKLIKEPNYFEITPVVSGFTDKAVSEKIASEIEKSIGKIKDNVKWEKSEKTNYHLSYIVDFASEKYLSLQLSGVSYNQDNSTNLYDNESLLFDMKTGARITLKDVFKDKYDANIAKIKALVQKDITENQQLNYKTTKDIVIEDNVLLDSKYMMVILKKGVYSDEQQYDIISYVNYADLLDTFDMSDYLR